MIRNTRGKVVELSSALAVALGVVALGLARYWIDPRFFFYDDMQTGVVGQALEIGRALAHGEWPLLSNSSWVAAAFAGEMQYGIFSPFVLGYDLLLHNLNLSLQASTTLLALLHMAVTAAGAYLLARDYDLPPPLAIVVAFSASMNGWLIMWAAKTWYTLLSSFAWLPWYWLGMRRLARAPFSPFALGGTVAALYLLITVGWPGTDLMALVLCTWFVVAAAVARDWLRLLRLLAANALASCLAAPMLFVAVQYIGTTARTHMPILNWGWRVPFNALFAIVLPTLQTYWYRWNGPGPHTGIEMAGGLVPLVGLVTALAVLGGRELLRRYPFEISLLAASVFFCVAPSLWMFQWSFRWLPLFHLSLAIAGTLALRDAVTDRESVARWKLRFSTAKRELAVDSRAPSAWMLIMVGVAAAAAFLVDQSFGLSMRLAFMTVLLGLAWLFADLRGSRSFRSAIPAIASGFTIVAALSMVPIQVEFPEFQIGEVAKKAFPYRHDVTYLGIYPWFDMRNEPRMTDPALRADPLFRPGNLAMASGLDFVNGYSPLVPLGPFFLLGVRGIWGHTDDLDAYRLLLMETRPGALLEHMSVEGLTLSRWWARRIGTKNLPDWQLTAAWGPDVVFERKGPRLPDVYFADSVRGFPTSEALVRFALTRQTARIPILTVGRSLPVGCAAASISDYVRSRHRSSAMIDTTRCSTETLLVFARPWVVGFRASLDGREVPVEPADLLMPAVRVPPGFRGKVEIWYWPRMLSAGFAVAGSALAVAILGLLTWAIRSRVPR